MRILVIGDVMLDRYWHGDVSRLSQEAPVPVVRMNREECRAGAAANVAMNCASLGAEVTLVGVTGDDESAGILRRILVVAGVRFDLLPDASIKTTQKLRVIGRNQQMVRVDIEGTPSLCLNPFALAHIKRHEIVVFSDYGKGALAGIQELIAAAKEAGCTVLVDPKGCDYAKYARADVVKPNRDEMREMSGGWTTEAQLREKVERIRGDAGIKAILLTRAAEGMTLYNGGEPTHIHTHAKEIYDVTGAGDTVMAALAVWLANGEPLEVAARAANLAAGIVCGKFGTSTVTPEELKEAMLHETR